MCALNQGVDSAKGDKALGEGFGGDNQGDNRGHLQAHTVPESSDILAGFEAIAMAEKFNQHGDEDGQQRSQIDVHLDTRALIEAEEQHQQQRQSWQQGVETGDVRRFLRLGLFSGYGCGNVLAGHGVRIFGVEVTLDEEVSQCQRTDSAQADGDLILHKVRYDFHADEFGGKNAVGTGRPPAGSRSGGDNRTGRDTADTEADEDGVHGHHEQQAKA